ncbi:hypothetical protein B0H34DRAFT_15171 [Crassisporium funariophilum]|nr:hypothetical protein B0H34DRAFT_15171 [Crassisporium funariophilum]
MSLWLFKSSVPPTPQQQPTQRSPDQSLLHYETGSPPPSARVDRKLKLKPRRPLRIWDYWKFGAIVAAKATEVTSDVLSHHIWGPRRKSWGIEMTIVTSLIRGAERHSAFVDIGTIRTLMSIGGLVPLPSDALVTPVTFRVKKRKLRGILAEFDSLETGHRELCGEWVVGRKTWQRMQAEWKASNTLNSVSPKLNGAMPQEDTASGSPNLPPKGKERVILYIHGGAYYLSSAAAQRIISIPLAKYTDSRVFALDYRLAPETCFPGPLHDVVSAYLRLVEDLQIPPENIIICGDSAGGGLSLALLMYIRDNGYAMPSSAILMSPWVDLTMSCESWDSNAPYDVVPFPTADNHMNPIALYLGEQTETYLTHPYASPLFGDFKGLPPLLIQAGDAEVLRDEIMLLAHKATLAGVEVRHELYEDAIHVFQAYPFLDASRRSFESMRNFVRKVLPQYQSQSPKSLGVIAEQGLEREIENEHAVVVGGDGVEAPAALDQQAQVSEFGVTPKHPLDGEKRRSIYRSERSGATDDDQNDNAEEDVGPSWVKSPTLPALPRNGCSMVGDSKEKHDFEHIENAESLDFADIPPLCLSPPSPSPMPHHSSSVPPPSPRPVLSNFPSSNSSVRSASSLRISVSPFPTPPRSTSASPPFVEGPRRIQSANSLATFALQFKHDNGDTPPGSPQPFAKGIGHQHHKRNSSSASHNFSINLFASSKRRLAHSRSTTFLGSPRNLTMSSIQQPPYPPVPPLSPSPSVRKKRSFGGLMMGGRKESGFDDEPSAGVQSLVDDWTRSGPANQTTVFSAQPMSR